MNTLNRKAAGRAWRLTKLNVPVKIIGAGGVAAGPPAPPHAMALISITLFGKRIKNPFFLSQMYSLLSEIYLFSVLFLLFFSFTFKTYYFVVVVVFFCLSSMNFMQ